MDPARTHSEQRAAQPRRVLLELLGSPNIRSRASVYRRYDHLVGSRTVRRPANSR